jgi:hypothetical protein
MQNGTTAASTNASSSISSVPLYNFATVMCKLEAVLRIELTPCLLEAQAEMLVMDR